MAVKQRREILETIKRIWIALVYGVMSAVGINMFLMHANSYSSGLLGLSQLLQTVFMLFHIHVSMSFLMAIFNIPLFIFAWRVFGIRYILFSGLAVLANIIFLAVIPKVSLVTEPLTNTLVGASLIGMSVGWFLIMDLQLVVLIFSLPIVKKGFTKMFECLLILLTVLFCWEQ